MAEGVLIPDPGVCTQVLRKDIPYRSVVNFESAIWRGGEMKNDYITNDTSPVS